MMPTSDPLRDDKDEKRAELLHDHYKDTFQYVLEHWKVRNRLFVFILVVLALLLFQLTSPNVLEELANSYIRGQTKHETPGVASVLVDFRFITSVLWFIFAYLVVQYYQRTILVDRLYIYLDRTETRINRHLGGSFVTREGAYYRESQPIFLKQVFFLYSWVFCGLLVLVVVLKIVSEWRSPEVAARNWLTVGFTILDTLIALVVLYYTALFLYWRREDGPRKEPPEDDHGAKSAAGS
ncbi:MAG TPA: hypothetical protein VFX96_10645 [Pyrinomonadaceae bacterium]|nr:hypothetical protein [Pyrinomonadaceae bacterium]